MTGYRGALLDRLRHYREVAEKAMEQVTDDALFRELSPGSNSIAIIAKHVAGNLRSRFTDFLTTDGEKPDRNRDGEFELGELQTRDDLVEAWDAGWAILLDAIDSLEDGDLDRTVTIGGEPLSVLEALQRSLAHTTYHVGQIVMLAKHYREDEWRSLSQRADRARDLDRWARNDGSLTGGAGE